MKNLLPLALEYLHKGYSIIPVGADKRPLISWKEYQSRKPTLEEVLKWWEQSPDAQVGIVTGAISDLTVVDIEEGGDFGLVEDETYTVQTGGGGRHYYFKYDADFRNAVRTLPLVDIRSEGGYVVASGSETQKGAYIAIKPLEVIQMSNYTKSKLKTAKTPQNTQSTAIFDTGAKISYPQKINTDSFEYNGAGKGSRNDSMAKFAGTIHAKLHPSLWSTLGWQIFESANMKNSPPLPSYELRATWESIGNSESRSHPGGRTFSAPKQKSWGPAEDPVARLDVKKEVAAADPSTPTQPSPQDITIEKVSEAELDPQEPLHVSKVAEAQVVDSDNTYPLNMAPFDEALLGGVSFGELIVVAGQSGHGKTTLIQDWTVTLAMGNEKEKKVSLPVLWFSYEVLAKPMWKKFQTMGATDETPIYMPRVTESGEIDWVFEAIEKAIDKHGVKVIAIDHIGFLRSPKGNYANQADAVTHTVRNLKRLAVKKGLIIMLPVHIRKTISKIPDLNDIRDSLGIAQEADSVFFISREKDASGMPSTQSKVWLIKNRKSGMAVSATFDFQFGRYYYNPDADKKKEVKEKPANNRGFKDDFGPDEEADFGNDKF